MQCPKCGAEFESVTCEDIEIDRCSGCGGIWFDAGELEELRRLRGARSIDVGDKRLGKRHNSTRNYRCPRCAAQMLTMVDAAQSHIEFESCGECSGTFLDAGEFTDMTELTVVERVKKMIEALLPVR